MHQSVIDFLRGLLESMIQGLREELKKSGIGNSIEENIEKLRDKLFITLVATSVAATGFFLISWGIASAIDRIFVMRGLGFVLIGMLGVLTGMLIYKK